MSRIQSRDDLISRSAAIKAFTGKPPEYYHTSYIVGELNCLPAVNAIPVEWLKEHVDGDIRDSNGNSYGRKRITVVEALSMWQKEQEAQDERFC